MKPKKEQLLYFDCEWVPISQDFLDLKMDHLELSNVFEHRVEKWEHDREMNGLPRIDSMDKWWEEKAHFHPEFCKMVCVSYGFYKDGELVVQSLYGEDEKKILLGVQTVFDKANVAGMYLCGYMIKRFDMPWLAKRMMINGIKPTPNLSVYGKKPWDIEVFDLPEVWGQGNMQESYTPFELSSVAMGMESPKNDLSGDKVKAAFYKGEVERIKDYCEGDVRGTAVLANKLIELLP